MNGINPLLVSVAVALTGAPAGAQTLRASCDNRSGSTSVDLSNSSGNPSTNGYNIDPSDIFQTLNHLSFPVNQSSGANNASGTLDVYSQFFGTNPGTHIVAFRAVVSGSITLMRSTLTATGQSTDNTSVCVNVAGASAGTPLTVRVLASSAIAGTGASSSFRFSSPTSVNLLAFNGSGSINRLLNLTANGTYNLQMQGNTGFYTVSSGTATVSADFSNSVAITCPADYNGSGALTVQDIFDYLNAWFAGDISADTDLGGALSVQDIFAFLNLWFAGCV